MSQERYSKLEALIAAAQPPAPGLPFRIVEIGVWNGGRAVKMAAAAFASGKTLVDYQGFDLFEEITEAQNHAELNAKKTQSLEHVAKRLTSYQNRQPGFTFELIKGNTRKTLYEKKLEADIAYIDGGHSVMTIRCDWVACCEIPLVVFDDVYFGLTEEQLDKWGANRVLAAIRKMERHSVEIHNPGDTLQMDDCVGTVGFGIVRPLRNSVDIDGPEEGAPPYHVEVDRRTPTEVLADHEAELAREETGLEKEDFGEPGDPMAPTEGTDEPDEPDKVAAEPIDQEGEVADMPPRPKRSRQRKPRRPKE